MTVDGLVTGAAVAHEAVTTWVVDVPVGVVLRVGVGVVVDLADAPGFAGDELWCDVTAHATPAAIRRATTVATMTCVRLLAIGWRASAPAAEWSFLSESPESAFRRSSVGSYAGQSGRGDLLLEAPDLTAVAKRLDHQRDRQEDRDDRRRRA